MYLIEHLKFKQGPVQLSHTYVGGGEAYEFFEDLNFGSGYRGGSVAIGVTDQAYEHRFVSSGIGSIKKTAFSGAASQGFTATDAQYISHTGNLILTIPNHTFTTSDTVGIDTGGLVFKCSKDDFFSNHPYPREVSKTKGIASDGVGGKDPFAGIQTGIEQLQSIQSLLRWSRWWRWNWCECNCYCWCRWYISI